MTTGDTSQPDYNHAKKLSYFKDQRGRRSLGGGGEAADAGCAVAVSLQQTQHHTTHYTLVLLLMDTTNVTHRLV